MKKISLTQRKFALVDDEDFEDVKKYKWRFNNKAYKNPGGVYCYSLGNIRLPNFILKPPKGKYVYHINGSNLDNRKSNLKLLSEDQIKSAQPPNKLNRSGFKGVSWDKRRNRWIATIRASGHKIYLGEFKNIFEAAKAYNVAALKYHGESTYLNDTDHFDKKKLFELSTKYDAKRNDAGFKVSIAHKKISERLKKVT